MKCSGFGLFLAKTKLGSVGARLESVEEFIAFQQAQGPSAADFAAFQAAQGASVADFAAFQQMQGPSAADFAALQQAQGPSAADFAAAFAYLDGPQADEKIVCADWALLDGLNELIDTNKLGAPVKFDFKAGCG
mgnify:CR=1 FL=1